jgi:PDDEXK-like uncharacterized protein DUF3799
MIAGRKPRKKRSKKEAAPVAQPEILSLREGIYADVPQFIYHNLPEEAVSRTDLLMLDPPERYRDYRDRTVPRTPNEFMDFGTAWHTRILEPGVFAARHILKKYETYRTDEAKVWRDEMIKKGVTILTEDEMKSLDEMEQKMREHPKFNEFFRRADGRYELTLLARHSGTGILRRCRIDAAPPGNALHDLKSTCRIRVSAENVGKYAWNNELGYQACYYLDIWNALVPPGGQKKTEFIFWFQESEPPYLVGAYACPHDLMEYCRRILNARMYLLAECREKGIWPGYKALDWAELPGWVVKQMDSALS